MTPAGYASRRGRLGLRIGRMSLRSLPARGLLVAALLLGAGDVPALDPATPLGQYGLDAWQEGLPQNSVHAVLQSRDGYLWLGTYEGLVRFNGVSFVVFDTRNTPALRCNSVWALHEDRQGTLWAATLGGGVARVRGCRRSTSGPSPRTPKAPSGQGPTPASPASTGRLSGP